ncbi:Uma2 family endonuclease [Anatilimnocola sp. NA78]|uniref:Uma2 family endonuclease n=1 Tax=Anatilimnocola sp. NA78 TaxID=3415683 RepID=UPI003CE4C63D
MSTAPNRQFTVEEYLAREERSELKHEYYRGEIFAMTGASFRHVQIHGNAYAALHTKLRGKPCQPLGSDMRLSVNAAGLFTYPDISVVCGEPKFDPRNANTITNPTLLIEILSPSTERYDRTTKFGFYRKIPSLQEYVLISQHEALIEKFTRDVNDEWKFTDAVGLEATLNFHSIACELTLAEIYDGVELDPPAAAEPA